MRIVAEHAEIWHGFGDPRPAHKSGVLDEWCAKVGRDPAEIERSVGVAGGSSQTKETLDRYVELGATFFTNRLGRPRSGTSTRLRELIAYRDSVNGKSQPRTAHGSSREAGPPTHIR